MPDSLLDVQGLETVFKTSAGVVHAVNGISFGLKEGETLGVVGESGCGKSVTMLSLLRLIPINNKPACFDINPTRYNGRVDFSAFMPPLWKGIGCRTLKF